MENEETLENVQASCIFPMDIFQKNTWDRGSMLGPCEPTTQQSHNIREQLEEALIPA